MASSVDRILLLDQPDVDSRDNGRPLPRWRAWARRARRLAAAAGRLQERALHPPRRTLARRALRRGGIPSSILVVCYGNICRSPYAAAVLARRLPPGLPVRVDSAGFIGPDRRPPAEAVMVGKSHGVRLEGHRSKTITGELVRSSELILVMEPAQALWLRRRYGRTGAVVLGDLDPLPIRTRAITDPFSRDEHVFADAYGRIDRCVAALMDAVLRCETR